MAIKAKKVLKEKGITQEDISQQIGFHITNVNAVLNGKQQCRVDVALKIAALAGMTVDEAFELEEEIDPAISSVATKQTQSLSPESLAPGI